MSLQLPLAVWGAGPPASTSSSAAGTTDIFNIQYSAATADCRGRGLQAVTSSYFHFKYLSSSTPHHITQLCSALLKYLNCQYCSIAEEVEVRAAQFWAGCVLTGRLLAGDSSHSAVLTCVDPSIRVNITIHNTRCTSHTHIGSSRNTLATAADKTIPPSHL